MGMLCTRTATGNLSQIDGHFYHLTGKCDSIDFKQYDCTCIPYWINSYSKASIVPIIPPTHNVFHLRLLPKVQVSFFSLLLRRPTMECFSPISQAILLFGPRTGRSTSECIFAGAVDALGSILVVLCVGIVRHNGLHRQSGQERLIPQRPSRINLRS